MIDLDELQSVRDTERRTDKLQQLRDSFYADAGEYIQQLRRERERAAERADDPFDAPEVNQLTDEIDTAEGTVEAIFERRIGKIVKAASLAAADQPIDADGLTAEERALFEDLVDDIVASRERVLATLDGETGTAPEAESGTAPEPRDVPPRTETAEPADRAPPTERGADDSGGVSAADLMGAGEEASGPEQQRPPDSGEEPGRSPDQSPDPTHSPEAEVAGPESGSRQDASREESRTGAPADGRRGGPAGDRSGDPGDRPDPERGAEGPETPVGDGGTVDRATVHVTADVGPILGVDGREYDLATDDVCRLPTENAEPLIEQGAAERLD